MLLPHVADLVRSVSKLAVRRPWLVVLVIGLSTVPAVLASLKLPVRSGLTELVPESRPSVIEFHRVRGRLAGISTLIVVAQGSDPSSLRRFVDDMAPRIRGLGPRYVTGIDEGNRELRRFVESHKYLYADIGELRALRDDVVARYDYEIAKRTGLDLGISDEPPALDADSMRSRFSTKWDRAQNLIGDGYYMAEGGRLVSIVVRTPFETADPRAFELESRIRALWSASPLHDELQGIRILFTGNLVTSAEEHDAVMKDLAHVGMSGVLLIFGIVFLFFLRVRVLLVLCATVGVACFWAFGVAFVTVGYLNSATGFLVSIIAGNGINFGILGTARYLEARVEDGMPADDAIVTAMAASAPGTLTAALCASAAYGSLALTDFRGFRHFGIIGGAGMLLAWVSSYTLLPALLAVGERVFPLRADSSWTNRFRALFAHPFVWLAKRFQRPLLIGAAALGSLALALSLRYVARDPLEYDMSVLRNEATSPSSARVLARRIDKSIDRFTRDSRALLTDRFDQVAPLVAELQRRRDAAPAGQKPFDKVVSVYDILPADQAERLALATDIADRVRRAHVRHIVSDEDWARIEPELPQQFQLLSLTDLPRDVAWPFEEFDGTRGRIVYLVPTAWRSLNDARYLMQWADSFREIRLPNGEVIRGSGDPVLLADMLDNVRVDAPKAIGFAVLATTLVVLTAFRGAAAAWLALTTVFIGLVWLVAGLATAKIHINFLNFVALPISIGVGADYSVNVLKRHEIDDGRSTERGLRETGGAIVLCSLTTLLGYAALTLSINGAVRSFGFAGALGELTMLLAAMLILPAILLGRHRAKRTRVRRSYSHPEGEIR